jgi:hypothetical protein
MSIPAVRVARRGLVVADQGHRKGGACWPCARPVPRRREGYCAKSVLQRGQFSGTFPGRPGVGGQNGYQPLYPTGTPTTPVVGAMDRFPQSRAVKKKI